MIGVEVAYAIPGFQTIVSTQVATDATVKDAITASGIVHQFPEIDLTSAKVGIFGKIVTLTDGLAPGDRVEIYRPLQLAPNQARLLRAKCAAKKA